MIVCCTLRFSALQRAEIAEIYDPQPFAVEIAFVSVLFNEPKLLKFPSINAAPSDAARFSALQRAEIAEIIRVIGMRGQ